VNRRVRVWGRTALGLLGAMWAVPAWCPVHAQSARVRDPGPGAPGRVLRDVTARPHRVVVARDRWALIEPEDTSPFGVVVVRGSARVDAVIDGDIVVVDGDLRLENGARIRGRAVAIGGHVFRSPFAVAQGGVLEFAYDRFDATPAGDDWALRWGPLVSQFGTPPLRMPGFAGFRVAAYSRVDGLALTWGPEFTRGVVRVTPALTWRTHRGVIDPSLAVRLGSRRAAFEAMAERTTATADDWIAGDLSAAAIGFVSGVDLRNWYRSDRASLGVRLRQDAWPVVVEGWAFGLAERVSAASGGGALPAPGPWTLAGPTRGQGFTRPNPVVVSGDFTTVLAGIALGGPSGAARGTRLSLQGETAVTPWDTAGRFTQLLTDVTSWVPLGAGFFADIWGRGAWQSGALPQQRWQSVGGPGTLLTEPVLGLRAPRLAFGAVRLGRAFGVGASAPALAFRAATAAAWAPGGALRRATNIGAQLDAGPVRLEFAYDPKARRQVTVLGVSWVPGIRAP
jgi:hypothetical protein